MKQSEWEQAARAQHIRAEQLQAEVSDLRHALNLLVNEVVEWFSSEMDINGHEHRFGIGVVMNAKSQEPFMEFVEHKKTQNRGIVFWLTVYSDKIHKYVTTYTLSDFKDLPRELEEEERKTEKEANLTPIARRAVALVDEAYKNYMGHRTPKDPVV
jgi:hypothetical protein